MFRNYLVTALRNIARHKLHSIITIGGLALGLACVIFVLLFVQDELSYDKWLPDTQNLYRMEKTYHVEGRPALALAVVPFPAPAAMRDEIPEVKAMTRLNYNLMTLMSGDRQFRERVAAVDPNFFNILKLPLVRGNPATALKDPESVILSVSAARKYFGDADAMGKIITTTANCGPADMACLSNPVPLKVTGIMRDIPRNTQINGDIFLSNQSITSRVAATLKNDWGTSGGYGYVVLAPGAEPRSVIAKFAPILDRAVTARLQAGGLHLKGSQAYTYNLTPFLDVHLTSSRWQFNPTPSGSWTTLYGVGVVGALILLVACFNFMNLATARALMRAREVALRKTHGARRAQVAVQFLGEAVLTALLSLFAALALVEILQPVFGRILQHAVVLNYVRDWPLLLLIVGVTVVAGLLSGVYPALVLSGFRPADVLRNNGAGQAGSGRLRMSLVVLQFAVSIGLGIAAAVVFSQISFARSVELGFRKDNILVVQGGGGLAVGGKDSFVQRLRSNPGILDVATANTLPFDAGFSLVSVRRSGQSEAVELNRRVIGVNAVQLLGMKLIAGRLLSDERAQDVVNAMNTQQGPSSNEDHSVLIDQAAASRFGLTPQQAVGQTVIFMKNHLRIVGVLANVKFDGAREPAKASIYLYDPAYPAAVLVRVRPGTVPQTLSFIDEAWHEFSPTKAMQRLFLDDEFASLYQTEERQGELFGIFVLVAISIACMGLFGLAAFTVGRRTREIGLRKVFGARIFQIVWLLLTQFSTPVLLANLIAWPLAWYYLNLWLQGFADRIVLSPLYFIAAGLIALAIAWATIFTHALRVARANPIHALRTE